MKIIAALALTALMTLPQLGSATVIRYDYTFVGDGAFGGDTIPTERMIGYGSFQVDTDLRITTNFSFYDDAGQYLYEWEGSKPFNEMNYISSLGWMEGGIGTYIAEGFEILTLFNVNRISEDQDPFRYLTINGGDENWALYDLESDGYWYVYADVTDAHVVPEPATLSLLALGLAAIGIRRRLRYS